MDEYLENIPELKNKDRQIFLYARLPSQETQPKQYDDKCKFWTRILSETLERGLLQQQNERLAFRLSSDIPEMFKMNGFKPISIVEVWQELVKAKQLVPVERILSQLPITQQECDLHVSTDSSLLGVVASAVHTLLTAINVLEDAVKDDQLLVYLPHMQSIADKLGRLPLEDPLIHFDEWKNFIRSVSVDGNLTRNDAYLLLGYLQSRNMATVKRSEDGHLAIKLHLKDTKSKQVISQAEEGKLALRRTHATVQKQLDELTLKERQCIEHALEAKRNNQLLVAKKNLLTKKALQPIIQQHVQHAHQLEAMLIQINHASNQTEILKAYELGGKALEQIMKQEDLNIERVDKTMTYVQDVLQDKKDLDDVLQQWQGEIQEPHDDDELEKELEQLVARADQPAETEELISHIPSVPQHVPIVEQAIEPEEERVAVPI